MTLNRHRPVFITKKEARENKAQRLKANRAFRESRQKKAERKKLRKPEISWAGMLRKIGVSTNLPLSLLPSQLEGTRAMRYSNGALNFLQENFYIVNIPSNKGPLLHFLRGDEIKRIPLTQDKFALVDDEDFKFLSQWKWYAQKNGKTFYAVRQRNVYMHTEIFGSKCDHKNRNGLDNRRNNLRKATLSQQQYNRMQKHNTSGYRGVVWNKRRRCWIAQITVEGRWKNLGCFSSIKKAARAYDEAAMHYAGEFAVLNFPKG